MIPNFPILSAANQSLALHTILETMDRDNMVSLLELPSDLVISIYRHYLGLYSLVRLDSAVCRRSIRSTHLANLARTCISKSSAFAFHGSSSGYDPVLCIRWLMTKGVSAHTLLVSRFKSHSAFPHFTRPDLLQVLTNLRVYGLEAIQYGWLEYLFVLSSNLRELRLQCVDPVVYQMLIAVSDHCHNLEGLEVICTLTSCSAPLNAGYELRKVLSSCKKLKQVCIFKCAINDPTMNALLESNVNFLVSVHKIVSLRYAHAVDNAVDVGNNCHLLWRKVTNGVVNKYLHSCVRNNHDPTTVLRITKLAPCYNVIFLVWEAYKSLNTACMKLELCNCSALTVQQMDKLFHFPKLQHITLHSNSTISNLSHSIRRINTTLTHLELHEFTAITNDDIAAIMRRCPNIKLVMHGMPQIKAEN